MISQLIKQELLTQRADKIQAVADYKQFLLDNKLSIKNAFKYKELEDEFKMNLFQDLLKADKSTGIRFNMIKDDNEKAKFIDDKITLTGYTELDTIKNYIKILERGITVADNGVDVADLLAHDLDAVKAIDSLLISWDGHKVYNEFKEATKALNKFYQFYNSYFSENTFDEPFNFLHHLLYSPVRFDFNDKGELEVNELILANHYFGEINRAKWELKYIELMKEAKLIEEANQKAKYSIIKNDE